MNHVIAKIHSSSLTYFLSILTLFNIETNNSNNYLTTIRPKQRSKTSRFQLAIFFMLLEWWHDRILYFQLYSIGLFNRAKWPVGVPAGTVGFSTSIQSQIRRRDFDVIFFPTLFRRRIKIVEISTSTRHRIDVEIARWDTVLEIKRMLLLRHLGFKFFIWYRQRTGILINYRKRVCSYKINTCM